LLLGAVQDTVAAGARALTGSLLTLGAAGWDGGPAGTTGTELPDQSDGSLAALCAWTLKV